MKQLPIDTDVDINLFQDELRDIDREFILNIVSIAKISTSWNQISYLFMTNDATYAYGERICKWLSLQHDPKLPRQIHILNDKKIIQVDSGEGFVVILTDDGQVYLASDDSRWQTNNTLRLISNDYDRFEMIACGQYYSLLLRQDGTVSEVASNQYHQLAGLKNVKMIAYGGQHCVAVTNTNQIYCWGLNNDGQLGLGDTNNRRRPSLVSFPDGSIESPIKNIVAGARHSLFVLEDGQIFGCGYGQHPSNDNRRNAFVPTKIPIENVQSVACKNYLHFSLALDQSSHYYAWGILDDGLALSLKKLDAQPKSFAAASAMINKSPITYGPTSIFHVLESNNGISFSKYLNNPDNYDVEFVIQDKRVLASKCYLKMASEYYSRMFSGDWLENSKVFIKDYSYHVYYSYLVMLHTGHIRIDQSNIAQLIDLANCYGEERLMKLCQTFIQTNLNERTISIYYPLIYRYQLDKDDEVHDKLVMLTIKYVWPKKADKLSKNQTKMSKFLELVFLDQ
ncbi:RCC1 and BTB domain-containing protein 2-like [Dermatophagoides pteronyssinus]|uniref:RCC1 and BTB domain-containing protein 2-like n=1 Tax=Dermatophagoides pteronyssinus TaxID=6956 RepID=UPI003F66BCE6